MRFFVFIAVAVAFAAPSWAQGADRGLSVAGRGEVSAKPDMATVSFGVETVRDGAGAAMAANSAGMSKVIAAIKRAGIAPDDIQTSSLALSPQWQRKRNSPDSAPRIVGYLASNNIAVRVRRISALGEIIDAAMQAGVNRVDSVSFGFSDSTELLDKALQLAVKDALRKAALYAEAAGVRLGPVISLSERGVSRPRPSVAEFGRAEMQAAAAPIERGEITLSASVLILVAIE